jgi:hypothetical protein
LKKKSKKKEKEKKIESTVPTKKGKERGPEIYIDLGSIWSIVCCLHRYVALGSFEQSCALLLSYLLASLLCIATRALLRHT